jgi:hypothetical protein
MSVIELKNWYIFNDKLSGDCPTNDTYIPFTFIQEEIVQYDSDSRIVKTSSGRNWIIPINSRDKYFIKRDFDSILNKYKK